MNETERSPVDIGFFALGALGFFIIAGGVITTCAAAIVIGLLLMLITTGYFALTGE